MKNTKRAERRFQTARKQKQRWKKWCSWVDILNVEQTEKNFGKMKKHNFGCGCSCCKPWKHGFEEQYTFAERRKLVKDKE